MPTKKKLKIWLQNKNRSSSAVMQKLCEHDKHFAQIGKKLDEHDKRFDGHDKRLDGHDKRLERIEVRLDRITEKLLEHDLRFIRIEETMVTKKEFYELYNKIDSFLALHIKMDQEVTIMSHRVARTEERLDGHDTDIKQLKGALSLS
ncbi:hypothetical protein HZA41_03505 [Candidatus Peregrinibacteria bacterium]|nr:hypothetical protein [Candidatus Peregrinibacteria bacterium]